VICYTVQFLDSNASCNAGTGPSPADRVFSAVWGKQGSVLKCWIRWQRAATDRSSSSGSTAGKAGVGCRGGEQATGITSGTDGTAAKRGVCKPLMQQSSRSQCGQQVQAGGIGDGDVESCGVGNDSHCGCSAVVMVAMFMKGWR
jgi:hypothetical protein